MNTSTATIEGTTVSASEFIKSIPTPAAIRARLDENESESKVLKKMLRLAVAVEQDREVRGAQSAG